MNFLNNLSFRWKLAIPLFIIAILIIIISSVGVLGLNTQDSNLKKIADEYLPSIDILLQADRDLYQAQVAERSFIFVEAQSNEFKALVGQHNENIEQVEQRLGKFSQLISSQHLKDKAKLALKKHILWKPLTLKVQSERTADKATGRQTAIDLSFGQADQAFNEIRSIIDEMTEEIEKEIDIVTQHAYQESEASITTSLVTSVIGVLFCLLVSFVLPKTACAMINKIIERVSDIASGQGDLTVRIDVKSNDELGILSKTFNQFLDKLQHLIRQIVNSSSQVSASVDHVGEITRENHSAITKQQQATDDVASAITQMTSSIQEVESSTANAADVAEKAMHNTKQGQQIVTKTINAIEDLAKEVDSASGVLAHLQEDSENIGSVLDVIKGIAEQTNLLALNAAIEAARAGEQGRGFAVVADEVRTLAVKTQESTAEIEQMIDRLQSGAKNAVNVMSEGRKKGSSAVETAADAGKALDEIIDAIQLINNMNAHIADAAKEQSQVSETIDKNIHNISKIAGVTAENSSKNEHSANELSGMAVELQGYIQQFKI